MKSPSNGRHFGLKRGRTRSVMLPEVLERAKLPLEILTVLEIWSVKDDDERRHVDLSRLNGWRSLMFTV